MEDVLIRLRRHAEYGHHGSENSAELKEAADEIEKLREALFTVKNYFHNRQMQPEARGCLMRIEEAMKNE